MLFISQRQSCARCDRIKTIFAVFSLVFCLFVFLCPFYPYCDAHLFGRWIVTNCWFMWSLDISKLNDQLLTYGIYHALIMATVDAALLAQGVCALSWIDENDSLLSFFLPLPLLLLLLNCYPRGFAFIVIYDFVAPGEKQKGNSCVKGKKCPRFWDRK